MGYKVLKTEFSQMSPDTCLEIEYNFHHAGLFSGSFW